MPDDIDVDDPAGDPPVPTPKPKPKPAAKPDPVDLDDLSTEELKAELRGAKKALKEVNASDQKGREARKKLQELEEEKDRLEAEKLSETEKRDRRAAAAEARAAAAEEKTARLERENLQMRIDNDVRAELKLQGVSMVELSVKALHGDPEIDTDSDTGKILGVKAAVARLIKANPDLVVGMASGRGTPRRDADPYRMPPREPGKPPGPTGVDQIEIDRANLSGLISYGF